MESISKYLEFMEKSKSSSANTLRAYHEDLRQFLTVPKENFIKYGTWEVCGPELELGHEELLALLRGALERWRNLSSASRNRKIATLKSLDRYLMDHLDQARQFTAHIPTPKRKVLVPHYISVDEVLSVLRQLKRESVNSVDQHYRYILFLVLYGGGLRVSEACQLNWQDYEPAAGRWRLKGKGGQWRVVPLPRVVLDEIRNVNRSGAFLFGSRALNPRVAYQWVLEAGAAAGLLKRLHPHALRHSYATHLLSSGASLRVLQDLLGHTHLGTTQKYLHLNIDQLSETMQKFHPIGKFKLKTGA